MDHNKDLKRMNKILKDAKANQNTWAKLPKSERISPGVAPKASLPGRKRSGQAVVKS